MNPFQIIYDLAEKALLDEQPDWRVHREHALLKIKDQAEHMLLTDDTVTVALIRKILKELQDTNEYKYVCVTLFHDLSGRVTTGLNNEIVLFTFPHVNRIAIVYSWWKQGGEER